jgi:hypothetical protein
MMAVLLVILALFSVLARAATHINDIPAKYQWQNNYGYCGELSFVQGGLFYGQYCSQYDSRAMSTPGVNQASESSQLLLGLNDQKTSENMRLNVTRWGSDQSDAKRSHGFLLWIKEHVVRGFPVTIGVLMNEYLFEMDGGDDEYDHIVTVYGIESDNLKDWKNFNPKDKLIIDDHYEYEGGSQR